MATKRKPTRLPQDPDEARRVTEAVRMRSRGASFDEIAKALNWNSRQVAFEAIQRRVRSTIDEGALAVDELRAVEMEHLDQLRKAALDVLDKRHLATGTGGEGTGTIFLTDPETGEYLQDDAPTLAAIDRLLKITERISKLAGLDSPVKVEGSGTLKVEVVGWNPEAMT